MAADNASLFFAESSASLNGAYSNILSGSPEATVLQDTVPTHEAALPGAVPSHPTDILWSPVSAPIADAVSAGPITQEWATATSNSPMQQTFIAPTSPPFPAADPGSVAGPMSGLGSAADVVELVSDSGDALSESGDSDGFSQRYGRMGSRTLFAQPICRQTSAVPKPASVGGCAPCPRFGHTAVVHKDLMIVFGGRDSKCYDDVWTYCFVNKSWRHVEIPEQERPRARAGHTAVVFNGAMYMFGGVAEEEAGGGSHTLWLSDFWMLDLNTWRWSEVRPRGVGRPEKRKGHTAVVYKRSMFVFGGGQDESRMNRDLWEFNFTTSKWIERHFTGHEPQERMYHVSAVGHGGKMLVFGGRAQTSTGFLNDLFEIDLGTFKCQLLTPSGPAPTHRMCSTAVYHNHTFAVFTGGSYAYLEDSYQLDLRKMQWMPIESRVGGRTRPTTVKWGNTILTFGGCVHGNGYVNDFIELELEPMSLKQCVKQYLTENRITLRDPGIPKGIIDFLDE